MSKSKAKPKSRIGNWAMDREAIGVASEHGEEQVVKNAVVCGWWIISRS